MTLQIDVRIDGPDPISGEAAEAAVDLLHALGDAVGSLCDGRIRRHHQDRGRPPPPRDHRQLPLFPELDIPF